MDLVYQATYRMIPLTICYLPRSRYDFSVLPSMYEAALGVRVSWIEVSVIVRKRYKLLTLRICRGSCCQMHGNALRFIEENVDRHFVAHMLLNRWKFQCQIHYSLSVNSTSSLDWLCTMNHFILAIWMNVYIYHNGRANCTSSAVL